MLKFSFFRTAKPRQFDYIPRYYDPEKERREERRRELLGPDPDETSDGKYVPGTFLRERIKYRRGFGVAGGGARRKKSAMTPLRGVLILIVLAAAVWWVLN